MKKTSTLTSRVYVRLFSKRTQQPNLATSYLALSLTAILIDEPGNKTLSLRISRGRRFGRSLLISTMFTTSQPQQAPLILPMSKGPVTYGSQTLPFTGHQNFRYIDE